MSRSSSLTLQLREYGDAKPLLRTLAEHLACSISAARDLLARASERVQKVLNTSAAPLEFTGGEVRALGIAGMLRITNGVELEVVPKYLDAGSAGWREDLLFLAAITRYGNILTSDRLGTRVGRSDDFTTLLARALVRLYQDAHRRPLRTYALIRQQEFAFDGDVDEEAIVLPPPEGYPQSRLELTRRNKANATILAAAGTLHRGVRDPALLRQLEFVSARVRPQAPPPSRRPYIPSRHSAWRPPVDLAWDILRGAAHEYGGRFRAAPGFVVDTWRLWEELVRIALGFQRPIALDVQRLFKLGTRKMWDRNGSSESSHARVRPDFVVQMREMPEKLIIDAKYKTRIERGAPTIAEADLYEALAFATGTGVQNVVLVYPEEIFASTAAPILGRVRLFEQVTVAPTRISAIAISTARIRARGGLRQFSEGLGSYLEKNFGAS